MEFSHEKLHTGDGEDDDYKENEESDLKERGHCSDDGFQNNLETCGKKEILAHMSTCMVPFK